MYMMGFRQGNSVRGTRLRPVCHFLIIVLIGRHCRYQFCKQAKSITLVYSSLFVILQKDPLLIAALRQRYHYKLIQFAGCVGGTRPHPVRHFSNNSVDWAASFGIGFASRLSLFFSLFFSIRHPANYGLSVEHGEVASTT